MRWLIVNGDDLGASRGINRGILEAHQDGILTSASLLVDRPSSEEAAAHARCSPGLSLGLHLELDPNQPEGLRDQLAAQLERFFQLAGAAPTHVDSHHDTHRDPSVLARVLAWAEQVGFPLRGYSPVRHVGRFYGRWGGRSHPEQIGVEGFLRLLDAEVGEGATELSCHPGYAQPPGVRSTYTAEREVELRTLCDARVRRGVDERQIRLIGFRDLPQVAGQAAAAGGEAR
ncbi:MAG: carbohydrate deacetylase [Gemmatimonadales bacterium]